MDGNRCFICGLRIGRGNHPVQGAHERMEKLVSVSQTVEHSSTIISDILSRILNETVMREETICRICFGLLQDIDYHLKEAQEKTDEITAKFLDKEKDPLSYRPQPIVSVEKEVSSSTEITISSKRQNFSQNKENAGETRSSRRHHHHHETAVLPKTSSSTAATSKRKSPTSKNVDTPMSTADTDSTLTEDEMSVNSINKNKAKLLSHVLNPNKKLRKIRFHDSSEKDEIEELSPRKRSRSSPEIEKESRKSGKLSPPESRPSETRKSKRSSVVASSASISAAVLPKKRHSGRTRSKKHISSDEDDDEEDDDLEVVEKSSPKKQSKNAIKAEEFTTVNMDELTDLFSKPKVYFAKKSDPNEKRNAEGERSVSSKGGSNAVHKSAAPVDLDDKLPITCNLCSKTFKKAINLQLHKEKVHNLHEQLVVSDIPETHKCSLCPREFTNQQSLHVHEMEHGNTSDEEIAGKKHIIKAKEATPSRGDTEPKASCPICLKTFKRQFNMKTHVNRVHNKVKPYVCSICEKSFATNSDLKQHMVVHGQGKTFACEICGREFSNRDSIILHRKQHTNQKTHFCPVCNKGFYKASCLNRHLRSHTGERPYVCPGCDKSFTQSTTLKTHQTKCKVIKKANRDFIHRGDSESEEI